jgi:hypothetical protein
MVMKMKILAIILLTATFAAPVTKTDHTRILSLDLPTTIDEIESIYGEPATVELPDPEDPSPMGQWFQWKIGQKRVLLSALADDYSQVPNHNAEVRVLKLKAINTNSHVKSIYGYTINETKLSTIQAEHKDTIQKSISYSAKYFENEIWTFYDCNENKVVNEIIQSSFNIDEAD